MRTIAVIPARFGSHRLPGKPLLDLLGKTMIERVYERASRARSISEVVVATDDERIRAAVEAFGGEVVLTSERHPSGTDRVAEAVESVDADMVVNLQGDEPLISPDAIDEAVDIATRSDGGLGSLRYPITERASLLDVNVVKVVCDRKGFALYFSRSPVPLPPPPEESFPEGVYFKHVGLYAYPKEVLLDLARLTPTPLEKIEKLEQLRAMENGIPIRLARTAYDSVAVDTPADAERVREILARERQTVN